MGKVKSVAKLQENGQFSDPIPLSVDLDNVDISQKLKNALQSKNITVSKDNAEEVLIELANLSGEMSGTLGVNKGGTGKNSISEGNVLVGGANNTFEEKDIDTVPTNGSSNLVTSGGVYTSLSNLPPKNHASTNTTYGIGNENLYGHVKVKNYFDKEKISEGYTAAGYNALVEAYEELINSGKTIDVIVELPKDNWKEHEDMMEFFPPEGGSSGAIKTDHYFSQSVEVPQIRSGLTPLFFLADDSLDDISERDKRAYAFSLITGCKAANGSISFKAAAALPVDIYVEIKGIPEQELEYVDNTVIFLVEPSAFTLNSTTQRYEATVTVNGISGGAGGIWDIVRSGAVLTEAESEIALSITDVDTLDNAVKISCLEIPAQRFMMSISGAYPAADPGNVILSGMQNWFNKVDDLEKQSLVIQAINLPSTVCPANSATSIQLMEEDWPVIEGYTLVAVTPRYTNTNLLWNSCRTTTIESGAKRIIDVKLYNITNNSITTSEGTTNVYGFYRHN